MRVREMTRSVLRIALGAQALICALALWIGSKLMGWRALTPDEIAGSPDARYVVETLLMRWGFVTGACVGLAIGLALMVIAQRRDKTRPTVTTRISWMAVVIPPLVVLSFGVALWR